MKKHIKILLPLVVLGVLFVGVFIPLPPQLHGGRIRDYVHDLGHFPACLIAFWAIFQIPWVKIPGIKNKAVSAALVVTIAQTAIEILQPITGRSASLRDWLLGAAGTLFGLGLYLLIHARKPHHKSMLVLKLIALIGLAISPLVLMVAQHQHYLKDFPVLGRFESRMAIKQWDLYGLRGKLSNEYVGEGKKSVQLTVIDKFSYPGFFMEGLVTDWTEYSAFTCDLYLEGANPRTITLRVDDKKEAPGYSERGQRSVILNPGFNTVVIPIADVMKTDSGRVMNSATIHRYGLYFEEKNIGDVFYVDNMRLLR